MRKLYDVTKQSSISKAAKRMSIEHNVIFNVIDLETRQVVQTHEGHNAATNSLLTGIAHYLIGDGCLNQANDMLSQFVPRFISLGTMGLFTQESDELGLPIGLGADTDTLDVDQTNRLCHYIAQCPGFGADGYDENENNDRPYLGLGPKFGDRAFSEVISCELISDAYPRTAIAFRDIVPESSAEIPKTIDVIYSAMISVGALSQFRPEGSTYLFITEAGLWSKKNWTDAGDNGLLAGYRIVPTSQSNWDLGTFIEGYEDPTTGTWISAHYEPDPDDEEHAAQQIENQEILRRNIIRVNKNQVVQVIWKLQIGGLEQLGGLSELYPSLESSLIWHLWDESENFLQFASVENFPARGLLGYIYQDLSTMICYRWNDGTKVYDIIQN